MYNMYFVLQVLRQQLGVKCVLGLTATASKCTVDNITELLDIRRDHVIMGLAVPDNLVITVSCEGNREQVN